MTLALSFIALGLLAGALSGLIGLGGGVFIVPALVLFFGFSQHRAEGTTLALLIPPIGILAVIPYFQRHWVDARAAVLICLGFLLGGWFGGHFATGISELILRRVFAGVLLVIAVRLFFEDAR
ncbi:MAG TPA: TSUP family transporter [Bryobacteraceae bacterium]|nr:TSUP family transporter [Bryobacteraceae bacterium]